MTDPKFKLRAGSSGPVVKGTPGHVLTFNADGESVSGQPGGGSIPLPIPVADLDASGVPNGYVVTATGGVAHWAPPAVGPLVFEITIFGSLTSPGPQVGETLAAEFTAAFSEPATSASLVDSEGANDPIALPATSPISPNPYTKTAIGENVSYTLNASGADGSDSATVTIYWLEFVRFGALADPGIYDETFIENLPNSNLVLNPQGSYGYNAGPTDFCFFAVLESYGLTSANFIQGVFPMSISKVAAAVPVTNTQGITETFDVWRSDNQGLGTFNMGVI